MTTDPKEGAARAAGMRQESTAQGVIFIPERLFKEIISAGGVNQASNGMGCSNPENCTTGTNLVFCTNSKDC